MLQNESMYSRIAAACDFKPFKKLLHLQQTTFLGKLAMKTAKVGKVVKFVDVFMLNWRDVDETVAVMFLIEFSILLRKYFNV